MKTYKYNGENGILANVDNDKFSNIKPIYENNGQGFYRLSDIKDIDVTDDDVLITYAETYNGKINEKFIPIIVCAQVENIENCEKLVTEWVTEDYAKSDEVSREYGTVTDKYYEWKSKVSEFIEDSRSDMEDSMEYDMRDDEDEDDFKERYKNEVIKPAWDKIIKDIKSEYKDYCIDVFSSEDILEMI